MRKPVYHRENNPVIRAQLELAGIYPCIELSCVFVVADGVGTVMRTGHNAHGSGGEWEGR